MPTVEASQQPDAPPGVEVAWGSRRHRDDLPGRAALAAATGLPPRAPGTGFARLDRRPGDAMRRRPEVRRLPRTIEEAIHPDGVVAPEAAAAGAVSQPTMPRSTMGNPVVHFELIGPQPERLRAVDAELFDWRAPAGAPVADRISAADGSSFIAPPEESTGAAGGNRREPGFESHAVFYVGVADVGAALRTVERLGGTVVLDAQRNEGGRVTVAHFRDPAGNLVGVAGPR